MKTMLHNNLRENRDKFNLLQTAQLGFRIKLFLTSNRLEMLTDITCYINNEQSIELITIDFAKTKA